MATEWIKCNDDWWNEPTQTCTVHEQEKPKPVIIYDHDGNALMRKPFAVGFHPRHAVSEA